MPISPPPAGSRTCCFSRPVRIGPGLVSHDLNYLGAIAAQCGQRLDALAASGKPWSGRAAKRCWSSR